MLARDAVGEPVGTQTKGLAACGVPALRAGVMSAERAMPDLPAMRRRYVDCNRRALEWLLARGDLHDGFLNTKINSITLADYTRADGWRGPAYTYGWIQGRGLEALALHAAFFEREDAGLVARLDAAGRRLYRRLAGLFERDGGHLYFCYNADFVPVICGADGGEEPQAAAGDLYTYADVFGIKGLLAAAVRYGDDAGRERYLSHLERLIAALHGGRFRHDERQRLDPQYAPAHDEFGPWMIVLGAAGLLDDLGLGGRSDFGPRLIQTVLNRFWPGMTRPGVDLVPDWGGAPQSNPGHALEFVGFALKAQGEAIDSPTLDALTRIFRAAFAAGFRGPGIVLSVDAASGAPLSPQCPWWSLPETIRAAALLNERCADAASASVWAQADEAFFSRYWRGEPPVAYQTLTDAGPVDFVPATPDLDPGYHTGLSLLDAVQAIDRRLGAPPDEPEGIAS